jgi:hypothetical protein
MLVKSLDFQLRIRLSNRERLNSHIKFIIEAFSEKLFGLTDPKLPCQPMWQGISGSASCWANTRRAGQVRQQLGIAPTVASQQMNQGRSSLQRPGTHRGFVMRTVRQTSPVKPQWFMRPGRRIALQRTSGIPLGISSAPSRSRALPRIHPRGSDEQRNP